MKKTNKNKRYSATAPNLSSVRDRREKLKKSLKRVEKKITNPTPDYSKKIKQTKIKSNKLEKNPLFINFLNWTGDKYFIEKTMSNLIEYFSKNEDIEIVNNKLKSLDENYLNNLTFFQGVFRKNLLETIYNKNISDFFLGWLSNCFNYIQEEKEIYIKDEKRSITIKDSQGKWFESIVCYNFIMTFNYFGLDIVKQCPVCKKFFSHKGPYAKYCSEGCKEGK
jgi:hypothetical protein